MSEVVSKWILHRLGIIIDMTPENFAVKTSNGHLLAEILQTYELITPEELSLIKDSDQVNDCYDNFKLISTWLHYMNLALSIDDVYEIVHGVGSASLHLFYQVFLELKDKTRLDFLTEKELNVQLGKQNHRFYVKAVDDSEDPNKLDLHREGLCEPFLAGGDVYHWYKDRVENLQSKCKDARDEYIHNVKNRCKSFSIERGIRETDSAFVFARGLTISPRPSNVTENSIFMLPNEDLSSIDLRNYEDLVNLQQEAKQKSVVKPDPVEAKKIMKNLHIKSKVRLENRILRNQLHQEIMNSFDRKINDSKVKSADEVLTDVFMKQSLYEKELVTKFGQLKMFKEYMLESKIKQGEILNKLKENDFMNQLISKDKELNEKKLIYYCERDRLTQLHKEIWKERMRLRQKRHHDICFNVVKDIADISLKIAEYKKQFGREPNKREMEEMKNMFRTSQSVFDICDNTINIIKDTANDMIPEDILTTEINKQNALDDQEFDRYMQYEWPWELKNVNSDTKIMQQIKDGMNVLGYIVHRSLSVKYPVVPLWEKPEFPDCNIRVCINGLNDTSILTNLRNLLSEKEIRVIELSDGVEFCIQAYKKEKKRDYDDVPNALPPESKQKKEKPEILKGVKSKKKKKHEPEDDNDDTLVSPIIRLENKIVQTPIKFPCEEIAYTSQALLGKTAQELLDEGQALGNFLLIDMFVEYLKSITNLKGWVLVNYPSTFEQAAVLEEALSGAKLLDPNMKLTVEKSFTVITDHEQSIEQDDCSLYNDSKRHCRLLPNPGMSEPSKVYDTVLTAYIRIKKLSNDDKTGDGVLPPSYEELGVEPDSLDKFYSNAGANYSLYYKEFDCSTIKYLGKLIIGDYSLPLKSSLELFGDVVNLDRQLSKRQDEVKATKKGEKLKKRKQRIVLEPGIDVSNKTSTKIGKKGKHTKAKAVLIYESKGVQVPSEDEEEEWEELNSSHAAPELIEAGQEGWEYVTIDCPEELLIALATLWESVEEIYINDMKQLFFLKRVNLASIMPFVKYVKDVMENIINRPDYKAFYLSKFQRAFNSFEMSYRRDDEFKTEMHCRIEDFKEKLSEMSDIKMMESENVRCRIINANWIPCQITELINTYINMIQIETDRFIESIRLINNYYLGLITGMPLDEESFKEEPISKHHGFNFEVVNNLFQDSTSIVDISYFDELLSIVIQKVHSCIRKLNALTAGTIEKTKSSQTAYRKSQSKASSPKSKASKNTKKSSDLETTGVKNNYDKTVEEWQCASNGETLRAILRVDLLKYDALQSIEEVISCAQNCFHEVFQEIRSKYTQEVQNIDVACKVFRAAVENENSIQTELLLDEHAFSINPEINMFDSPSIIPELPSELIEEGAFSMLQLSKLAGIFLHVSPGGYLPKSTFTFILQDIIWVSDGTDSQLSSPKLWRKLNSQSLKSVVNALYDDLEYVYWKDFIIYNIRVPFPTERELLLTRKALRECDPDSTELIQDYQFFGVKLWFEYTFKQEDQQRIVDVKQLLFKLYYIKNYGINYTALLLDFCKDQRSVQGFAKALELSSGKIVCWNPEIGNKFKDLHLKRNNQYDIDVKNRDEQRFLYYKAVYEEVLKLVDQVIHVCEDVILEDIDLPLDDSSKTLVNKLGEISEEKVQQRSCNKTEQGSVQMTDPPVGDEGQLENSDRGSQTLKVYRDLPDNVYTETDELTEIMFFLSVDVIIAIITAALPWHSRVENIGDLSCREYVVQIFENCKNADFGNSVLAHEFLNSENFLKLLSHTKKFEVIDPVKVVKDMVNTFNGSSLLNTSS